MWPWVSPFTSLHLCWPLGRVRQWTYLHLIFAGTFQSITIMSFSSHTSPSERLLWTHFTEEEADRGSERFNQETACAAAEINLPRSQMSGIDNCHCGENWNPTFSVQCPPILLVHPPATWPQDLCTCLSLSSKLISCISHLVTVTCPFPQLR